MENGNKFNFASRHFLRTSQKSEKYKYAIKKKNTFIIKLLFIFSACVIFGR